MDASTSGRWIAWRTGGLAAVFAFIAVFAASDLAVDFRAGTTWLHVVFEATTFCVALFAAGWLAGKVARERRRLEQAASMLRVSLTASRQDADRWRHEAAKWAEGLSDAIDRQLNEWGLSPAEKEIALLLLKGLSHKEIAQLRSVEESSVRQQARSLYRKAHLQGRNELAAFFLEDLLAPRATT